LVNFLEDRKGHRSCIISSDGRQGEEKCLHVEPETKKKPRLKAVTAHTTELSTFRGYGSEKGTQKVTRRRKDNGWAVKSTSEKGAERKVAQERGCAFEKRSREGKTSLKGTVCLRIKQVKRQQKEPKITKTWTI